MASDDNAPTQVSLGPTPDAILDSVSARARPRQHCPIAIRPGGTAEGPQGNIFLDTHCHTRSTYCQGEQPIAPLPTRVSPSRAPGPAAWPRTRVSPHSSLPATRCSPGRQATTNPCRDMWNSRGAAILHRTSVEAGVSRTVGCRLPGCTPTPDRQRIATTEDALGGWPRLVIGVPTLGERSITGLLNELRRQAPEADIIVAFNGSSIGRSAVEAAVAESRSRLVESPRGYSYARNALLDAAKDADYLIYFDDDQIPDKGWFSAMVQVTSGLGPDVVLGPVLPILPTGAWASPYDLRHAADTDCGPFVGDGYSGNTAVRVHKVRAAGIHFGGRICSHRRRRYGLLSPTSSSREQRMVLSWCLGPRICRPRAGDTPWPA